MDTTQPAAAPSPRKSTTPEEKWAIRMRHLLTQIGDRGHCRGCQAEIFWIRHKTGRISPYNANGESHFATCVDAERFRKSQSITDSAET